MQGPVGKLKRQKTATKAANSSLLEDSRIGDKTLSALSKQYGEFLAPPTKKMGAQSSANYPAKAPGMTDEELSQLSKQMRPFQPALSSANYPAKQGMTDDELSALSKAYRPYQNANFLVPPTKQGSQLGSKATGKHIIADDELSALSK